jgi:DMSO/TMAO reductase YedYZ heme-binding membrane subunit
MDILKSKQLNGWPLFYLIAGINSAAVIAYMPTQDLTGPLGVSEMIQMTVRCSVPLLYLAFAASAMKVLFPSKFTRWLVRNRRSIGISYAAAMAWQLLFILWMWSGHWDYYTEEVYSLEDILFQVTGYMYIIAMTITSFHPVRRRLSLLQWRVLHKTGIYFLWFTVVDTYYYELTYYNDRQVIDYIFAAAGLLVFLMRVTAWGRLQMMQTAKP